MSRSFASKGGGVAAQKAIAVILVFASFGNGLVASSQPQVKLENSDNQKPEQVHNENSTEFGNQKTEFSESQKQNLELREAMLFVLPSIPAYAVPPSKRSAAGARDRCDQPINSSAGAKEEEQQLTALAPVYMAHHAEMVIGLTTASHPTFWFYVPFSKKLPGEFVLQNETDDTIYQRTISLSGTPGVVSVSLPSTVPALQVGKRYHWYFNVYCEPEQPPVFVEGWVKRSPLNPALKSKLSHQSIPNRANLYAANGIWYDALTTVAKLRIANPKDLTSRAQWVSLLHSVGLDAIKSKPLNIRNLRDQTSQARAVLLGGEKH